MSHSVVTHLCWQNYYFFLKKKNKSDFFYKKAVPVMVLLLFPALLQNRQTVTAEIWL